MFVRIIKDSQTEHWDSIFECTRVTFQPARRKLSDGEPAPEWCRVDADGFVEDLLILMDDSSCQSVQIPQSHEYRVFVMNESGRTIEHLSWFGDGRRKPPAA